MRGPALRRVGRRLAAYSDGSTQPAQDPRGWLRGVLEPALEKYLQGAAARSDGTNIDIGAVRTLLGAVRSGLPRHVAAVYYTGRHVRRVGLLFAAAGRAGRLPSTSMSPLGGSGLLDSVVRTDDKTLDDMAINDRTTQGRVSEVAGGLPLDEVARDEVDAGADGYLVFAAGGVSADDLVSAAAEDGDGGESGEIVLVGLDDDEGNVRGVEPADRLEQRAQ